MAVQTTKVRIGDMSGKATKLGSLGIIMCTIGAKRIVMNVPNGVEGRNVYLNLNGRRKRIMNKIRIRAISLVPNSRMMKTSTLL